MPPSSSRPPIWAFALTCASAAGGLALNSLQNDAGAFAMAALMAAVAVGISGWLVWRR